MSICFTAVIIDLIMLCLTLPPTISRKIPPCWTHSAWHTLINYTSQNNIDFCLCFAVERSSHFPDMFDFHTFLQDVLMSEGIDMGMWSLHFFQILAQMFDDFKFGVVLIEECLLPRVIFLWNQYVQIFNRYLLLSSCCRFRWNRINGT